MGWKLNHRRITNCHFSGVRTSSHAGLLIISEQGTQCKSFTSQSLAFITLASILPRTQHVDLQVNPEQSHFLLHHFTQVSTMDKSFSVLFLDLHLSNHFFLTVAQDYPFAMSYFFCVIRSKFKRSRFRRKDTE